MSEKKHILTVYVDEAQEKFIVDAWLGYTNVSFRDMFEISNGLAAMIYDALIRHPIIQEERWKFKLPGLLKGIK